MANPKLGQIACRQCREPISLLAERCPHCLVWFSREEIARRTKEYWIFMAIGLPAMLGALWLIGKWMFG
jgi:hypothetical protein